MDREELLREKLEEEWRDDDSYEEEAEEKNDRFCWNPSWF